MNELIQVGDAKYNIPFILKMLDQEAAEAGGSVRTQIKCVADLVRAQQAEIARLTAALATANANHEHFEREWYLRGDQIEDLQADMHRLRDQFTAELQRYREALETAAARYESLMKDTFNCGDPHAECPMQDSCKPYHMTGELKRFRALLAEPKDTQQEEAPHD